MEEWGIKNIQVAGLELDRASVMTHVTALQPVLVHVHCVVLAATDFTLK